MPNADREAATAVPTANYSPNGAGGPALGAVIGVSTGGSTSLAFKGVNSRFTKRYAIAVLVGLVPVFVSPAFWWIPVLSMLGFFVWGYSDADDHHMVYEFADAFYYLGFTLSIGSLLAALDPFHVSSQPDTVKTFHQFGLGMFTTLIGVTGRTVLQSYHRLPSETLDAINRQIAEQGLAYVTHLERLNERTGAMLGTTIEAYQRNVLDPLARLGEVLQRGVQAAADAAAQSSALRLAAEEAAAAIRVSSGSTSSSVRELGVVAAERYRDVAALGAELRQITQGPDGLTELAKHVGRATHIATEVVTTDVVRLQRAVNELSITSSAMQDTAKQIDVDAISKQVNAIEAALKQVASAVDQHGQVAAAQAKATEAQLSAATKAATQVNLALDEVAEAVTKRLERIG